MAELGSGAAAAGHRLEAVEEIGSTSAALLERARTGEHGPLWLVSDVQTAGRGRNARNWVSPKGNLYISLLLSDPAAPAHIPELSFVLSLALRDAVLAAAWMVEDEKLRLKWPNDLMYDGAKTAGLLLEGGQHDGAGFVVAGFGVNVVSHPEGTVHRATDLRLSGWTVNRDGLAQNLTEATVRRLEQWQRGEKFSTIRHDWLRVSYRLGQPIRVTTLNESMDGDFEGIDPTGRLLLATSAGLRRVSAGEVFPLATESIA